MGRRGLALPSALLLCLALGFVAAAAAHLSLTGARIARGFDAFHRVLHAADGGLARGVEQVAAAYEAGRPPADTLTLVSAESLGLARYSVRVEPRREPPRRDLNGNGVTGEVVRFDRSWGFPSARAAGGPAEPGEPVRLLTARAWSDVAAEQLLLEVAFERDPGVADPAARGAWRAVPLRWSSVVGHR